MRDQLAPDGALRIVAPDRAKARARLRALSRRTFIGASLSAAAGSVAAGAAAVGAPSRARAAPVRPLGDPFGLGIASGDPTETGVVLWTRLAVDPLAEDGRGGMPSRAVPVHWQLAGDPRFRSVLRAGTVVARPDAAHSVHVEVEGLEPARDYYYRFRAGRHLSGIGRTRTMPAAGSVQALSMIVLSCTHYEGGYFTAYRHAAAEAPDLVLELGDYIYEGRGVDGRTRKHPGPMCVTLADYRRRYALYKNEAETQELHAAAPWIVTWDDHEVQDNWAAEYPKRGVPSDEFEERRAAAARAYYENMPLRRTSAPRGPDIQLYRRLQWGRLATFHVLDTRQYRSPQACRDRGGWWYSDCPERSDPDRSITGDAQERWLLDGLDASTATWQVIPQGVFFSQRDISDGPARTLATDGWDGYVASRNGIRDGWVDRGVENAVVLTGDVHMHFANEIKADFDDPASATVGTELVTTSVTSRGDGSDDIPDGDVVLAENPHIKFINDHRGYVRVHLDEDEMRSDFMGMSYVSRPGAPISPRASFVTEAGNPGLHRV